MLTPGIYGPPVDVDDNFRVANISMLSPKHFVSNIRHQHRCSRHRFWSVDPWYILKYDMWFRDVFLSWKVFFVAAPFVVLSILAIWKDGFNKYRPQFLQYTTRELILKPNSSHRIRIQTLECTLGNFSRFGKFGLTRVSQDVLVLGNSELE